MPVAKPDIIPIICKWLSKLSPKRILDVGVGFGLWGFLSREYGFIWKEDLSRQEYKNWRNEIIIDGIEICEDNITELQRMIYNKIFIGDVKKLLSKMETYDLIIFGDVLEHLEKEEALRVLEIARKKSHWVIISTPNYFDQGRAVMGNEYEKHLCLLEDNDFPGSPQIIHIRKQKVIIYENENIKKKEQAFQNLLDFKRIMEKLNIPFVLIDGTALGVYRDNDFCPGDENDIDVGVSREYAEEIPKIWPEAEKKGFKILKVWRDFLPNKLQGCKIGRNDNHIDVCVLDKFGDEAFNFGQDPTYKTGKKGFFASVVSKRHYEKFLEFEFKGEKFNLPSDIEDYLKSRYGKNWRIPVHQKDFKWWEMPSIRGDWNPLS